MGKGIYKRSESIKKALSNSWTTERKLNHINKHTGKHWKCSDEARKNMSMARKGEKNPSWKGGSTPVAYLLRHSFKYAEWRQKVFIRDKFTCQRCGGNKSGTLEAHHKIPFSILLQDVRRCLPLLSLYEGAMIYDPLWNLDNGETLCTECHNKTRGYVKRELPEIV